MGQENNLKEMWPTLALAVARQGREDGEMSLLFLGLRLPGRLDTSEEARRRDAQGIAKAEENVHRGRLPVVLKLADVGAVNLCRRRKLLLRQVGFLTSFTKFMA